MDVSALDFEEFVRFFFARTPLASGESFTDRFCPHGTPIRFADPRRVVMHLDAMCTAFKDIGRRGAPRDYGRLDSNDRAILDTVFETLDAILASDDSRCQWYALHGLGHLRHPRVPARVTRFIEVHAHELGPADVAWLEQCRDGIVM